MEELKQQRILIKSLIERILTEFGYNRDKAPVMIYGELTFLSECEVRALQVIAMRAAKLGDDIFKDFCENVIVYSGKDVETSTHKMHFRKDGKFIEEFEPGFFDVESNLAFELF